MTLEEIISALVQEMNRNKELFYRQTIGLVEKSSQSHYTLAIKQTQYSGDIKSLIERVILDDKNPQYGGRWLRYSYDKELLKFIAPPSEDFEKGYQPIEKQAFDEYWKQADKIANYNRISNFEPFIEVIVPENEWVRYARNTFLLNDDGWMNYSHALIDLFYPQFKYDKQRSSGISRYSIEINPQLLLCLEYDEKATRSHVKNWGVLPDMEFTFTLLTNDFKRSIKSKEYISEFHKDIRTLCLGKHPIFYEPCTPISRMEGKIAYSKNGFVKFEKLPDGQLRLYNHNCEDGEFLKKYMFFYMDIYSHYLNSYLDFIRYCLSEID